MSEPSLPEKVVAIHERLARAKTAHAFGGALALAYYAEPRATIDIDVNVFVSPSNYATVERDLAEIGVGDGVSVDIVKRDGQCRLRWGNTPVDLFFAYDDLHQAMRMAIRKEPFGQKTIPVLSPEHLAVCKTIFNRPKDWLDIEQMLVCVEELDDEEIRRWLKRILGSDDPRSARFEEMLRNG
ncbi:MAG TPA: nucleotidyl transferase AbiEii/AbiGii toxin family protein [Solirubrobacteraceae bacterium]